MIRRLLIMTGALALLVGACGDDDGDTAANDADADADASAVTIEGFEFVPATIEVPPGTTITWTNDDSVTHTVTAGEPAEPLDTFDQSLGGGESADIAFDEAGTFAYFCAIHPQMTGEVVVG